jgi:hypothetical protein
MDRVMSNLLLPAVSHNEQGEQRRIGVELEMIGLDIETISHLVSEQIQGTLEKHSRFEYFVKGDPSGDWGIELDFNYLKEKGRQQRKSDKPLDAMEDLAIELIKSGAEKVVPMEVVSPPLPMDRLNEIETLVERLRQAGARGTTDGLVYAFGMQLNPEVPATGVDTILRYFKAFLVLFDWLKARARVDLTRRLTPYIAPFPASYVKKTIASDYWPDMSSFIDDYLEANPTRNRALDMLPLFSYLDEDRVRSRVDDPRIKSRPTFHYRLPNCEIDREDWNIHLAWADWLQVETLANDKKKLYLACKRYSEFLNNPAERLLGNWVEQTADWITTLKDH